MLLLTLFVSGVFAAKSGWVNLFNGKNLDGWKVGNTIRTWLNGVPCANLVDDMTASGLITLQVHAI